MLKRGTPFWDRGVRNERGCLLWTGATSAGYGHLKVNGTWVLAHRHAYALHHGLQIPAGMLVMHTCDTPSCFEPTHLRLGTYRDNMRDMIAKGRAVHHAGSRATWSKLDEVTAAAIRNVFALGLFSRSRLARWFGVGHGTISDVVAGKRWAPIAMSNSEQPFALDGRRVELGARTESAARWSMLFPLGTFHRADFPEGKIEFTAATLGTLVENWKRAGSPELPIDFFHLGASHVAQGAPIESKVAAGWIQALELRPDGLYAQMKWTDRAREHIKADELRYLSPYFHPNGVDRKTGMRQGLTLHGAGLLNDPFLQDLPKVAASSTVATRDDTSHVTSRTGDEMTPEEIRKMLGLAATATDAEVKARAKELADAKAASDRVADEAKALAAKNADALALAEKAKLDHATQLSALQSKVADQEKALTELRARDRNAAADAVVAKLEGAGHILPAQREQVKGYALNAGPDEAFKFFSAFKATGAVVVDPEKGITGDPKATDKTGASTAKEANEKLNALAAELVAGKKAGSIAEAMVALTADPAHDKLVTLAMQNAQKREN